MAQELTREDFFALASQLGLDISDDNHMEELFHHVTGVKRLMSGLFEIETEEVEPSNVFSPVRR